MRNPALAIALAALGASCGPRADAGRDQWQVGFDVEVTLDGSRSRGARSFAWQQVAGPKVVLAGADQSVAHLKTRPLGDVVALSEYPGPVAMGQGALYRFRLTVRDGGGRQASAETTVTSASPVPGTGGVPLDTDAYMNGGLAGDDGFAWKLTAPEGSHAVLQGAASRTPHFRPDVRGVYTVLEEKSGYNFFLWSGRYDNVPKDCGRTDCHAREDQAWQLTKHAHAARHQPECVRCHSVGFDPGAQNGGFDEACPGGQCVGDKAVLGVVHCLACHGPGFRSAANYAEGSCAQCHDAPPKYSKVAEWRQAKMARLSVGLEPKVQAVTGGCPDCHSSQGFVRWMKGKPATRGLGPTYAAPIACPTCHDPHSAERPHQLRVYGQVTTRSGLVLEGVGAGALCATCHNAGRPREQAVRERRAPHAPQAELVQARHEPDLCVTCHVQKDHGGGGHTFAAGGAQAVKAHEVRARIEPLLAAARDELARRASAIRACGRRGAGIEVRGEFMVVVDASGHDLGDCNQNGQIDAGETSVRPPDDALAARAYDYFLIERDKSFGYHNPELAEKILGPSQR
ncbi:MAG TPA: hypothetical protein VKN99_22030 [Polyangia bacterium]|nr:hypothetical protein [Polyangia bacterium]